MRTAPAQSSAGVRADGPAPARLGPGRGWIGTHWLVLATGLVGSLPIIVSVVRALGERYAALADDGVIAVRSYDVLSSHPPLLGQYSVASLPEVGPTHSPGPMLYWLLAVPAHLLGDDGLVLTVGLANVASVMGAVAIARRRGGIAFMVAVALAIAVMCLSLSPENLHRPLNPAAGLLPLTLLILVSWSVAAGDLRLLPLAVLLASFVMQAHLTFVLPGVGLVLVASLGLAWSLRRSASIDRRHVARWVLAAALVGLVCWSAPLIEQALHSPGNLVRLVRTVEAGRAMLGFDPAWHTLVRGVGAVPWWLRPNLGSIQRFFEALGTPPRATTVTSLAVVGALLAVLVMGLRRRRAEVAAAAAVGLVLAATLAADAGLTPKDQGTVLIYTLWWGSPAGMWAWLAVAYGVVALWRPAARLVPRASVVLRRPAVALVAGAGAALAVGLGAVADQEPDTDEWRYDAARTIVDRVRAELPRGGSVSVAGPADGNGYTLAPAVVFALRRHDVHPLVSLGTSRLLGSQYDGTNRRSDASVVLFDGSTRPPTGARVIARVRMPEAPKQVPRAERTVSVALVDPRTAG